MSRVDPTTVTEARGSGDNAGAWVFDGERPNSQLHYAWKVPADPSTKIGREISLNQLWDWVSITMTRILSEVEFNNAWVAGVTLGKWKKPQRSSSHRNSTSNKHEKTTSQSEPQFRLRKQFIYYCSDTCTVDVQIEHWCRRENAFLRIAMAMATIMKITGIQPVFFPMANNQSLVWDSRWRTNDSSK